MPLTQLLPHLLPDPCAAGLEWIGSGIEWGEDAPELPSAGVSLALACGSMILTVYTHGKKDFPEKIKEASQYKQLTQSPPLSKYVPISKTIKTAHEITLVQYKGNTA